MNYVKNLENELIQSLPEASTFLNDIRQEIAERAFMNTSFSPEKRGVNVRAEYVEALLEDKIKVLDEISKSSQRGAEVRQDFGVMFDEWFKSHREKLCDCYNSWLHSHAKVASSFIVGPANFPVARNQKLSNYADAKLTAIDEFRKKSIKNILKFVLPYGDGSSIQIDDPNACDKIDNKIEKLEAQREEMKAINKLIRKYFKNGCPDISPENLGEFKNLLHTEFNLNEIQIADLLEPNYYGKIIGFKRWELQNLGANINRYKKRIAEVEKTNSKTIDDEFENGIKVTISDDQKICIHFGFKPSEEIRTLLKEKAFKFSRNRNNAWVRKFTLNAAFSYEHFIKPSLKILEKN
ncbi:hypothetical protein Lnau_3123 [Legionella nautarum]|uniref:Uncharacterized protein n=1 Tax=Legionella nautarum TaxID=45070 RepID=A0A0W0WIL9_9GAMM|nr:hypothetical protein [Legionella nautarum]KTD32212.1 hypothetical protein Lnau_3123 [Legionella nautarum]